MGRSSLELKLLLVGDDAARAAPLTRMISAAGFTVTLVGDAESTLDELDRGWFDVVVIDRELGGFDAIGLLEMVAHCHPDVRIVVLDQRKATKITDPTVDLELPPPVVDVRELEAYLRDVARQLSPRVPAFDSVFHAMPAPVLLLEASSPGFHILEASDAYLAATMTRRETLVGRPMFEAFPDNPADPSANGVPRLRASLERVLESRREDVMSLQRYDIRRWGWGEFEERHWAPRNAPVVRHGDSVVHIVHRVDDVTAIVRANLSPTDPSLLVSARASVRVGNAHDLVALRDAVRAACQRCGLSSAEEADVLSSATELGRAMLVLGNGGEVVIDDIGVEQPRAVRLQFRDHEESTIDRAVRPYAQRSERARELHERRGLVDAVAVDSSSKGTTVTTIKWRRAKTRA